MSEGKRIADLLERSLQGEAWHGPSLMEIIADVSAAEAREHPVPDTHSMAELVPHITAWISAATRGLDGAPVELQPTENWPPVTDDFDWARAVQDLRNAANGLATRAKTMDDDALRHRVYGSGRHYPTYALLHGVIQHNLYHAGQLALLKKAVRAQ